MQVACSVRILQGVSYDPVKPTSYTLMLEVNKACWEGLLQVCTVELPKIQAVLLDDSHVQHAVMERRCYFFMLNLYLQKFLAPILFRKYILSRICLFLKDCMMFS